MDPLSITSAVVGLTATCLSTCRKLHDLTEAYEDIPMIIASICSESTIVGIGLSKLQAKILQRDDLSQAWASPTEMLAAFEKALTGCKAVFDCLEDEIRPFQSNNSGVWVKMRFMWNQERFKELLIHLRGQQTSITFLLNLLQMDSLSSIQKDIRQNSRQVQNTAEDAQSLRLRNPSIKLQSQSIFGDNTSKLSLFEFGILSGVQPSELDFEFDDAVVNSKVYRRELRKAQAKNQQISTLETAAEEPDQDTFTLRGNSPAVEVLQTGTPQPTFESLSTDMEDLWMEIADSLLKTTKSVDGEHKRPQNRDLLTDNPSSTEVCYICDKSPAQSGIFSEQQPCYLHEGRKYCHVHFCLRFTASCHACKFPIMAPPSNQIQDQADKNFHRACYGIIHSWDIRIPVSPEGRHYIVSIKRGLSNYCFGPEIQQQHEAYIRRIYQVGTKFISGFEDSLSQALQYQSIGKDRKEAFELWKAMLKSALCLFHLSESLLSPEAAEAAFSKFFQRFQRYLNRPAPHQKVSTHIIARHTTAMLELIFEADLDVLLNQCSGNISWDKDNERLDSFLSSLSTNKPAVLPLVWFIEPKVTDKELWVCEECSESLYKDGKGMCMRLGLLNLSSRREKWHPDCLHCETCYGSVARLGPNDELGFARYECKKESCGYMGKFFFVPHYYKIVHRMWRG